MSLIRYTAFPEVEGFPSLRLFQDSVNRLFSEPSSRPWVPPVDIKETENELVVKADIPDVELKDIDVRLENGNLTIRGERNFEKTDKSGEWHRIERSFGSFERVFTL